MKKAVIFLLFIIGLGACRKDHVVNVRDTFILSHDTIFPKSYFPVYPGSFWKYVDSNGDTSLITSDPSYKLDTYTLYGSPAGSADSFYVPVYNHIPVWGYEENIGYSTYQSPNPLVRIVSDSLPVGTMWGMMGDQYHHVGRKITAKDTTILLGGNSYYPTIVVEEFDDQGSVQYLRVRQYFTLNIGIIREEDNMGNTKDLIQHFINH